MSEGGVSTVLDNRMVEILESIREVLSRLATLEEKTQWHNDKMKDLSDIQLRMADKLSDHEKDRSRIALLERDLQYLSGEVSKNAKSVEVLTGIVSEILRNDATQGKTVGFIERAGSTFILAILSAGGGALAMKILGA